MSPLGLPLLSFHFYKHLLLALKDAVVGHRYLYTIHHVFHRDVSCTMVPLHPQMKTPPTDLYRMTDAHSPIQDLESFHYILLEIVIHHDECGALRNLKPCPTIFTSLSVSDNTHDLWSFAASKKDYFLNQTRFIKNVMPTFNNTAQSTLWPILDGWQELIVKMRIRPNHMRLMMNEHGIPVMVPPHGQQEEEITAMYDAVLAILEQGITALGD
ncbi:hypothetical protein FN846DRAFT_913932 [Sphaerosporella brunnea]|uniref:Fungal-type protein kinase domain-containing protein n=1 Tax=Sphaerosporella brunnea TaxID=1250544 RepID=A0A5J5EE97_9PEZI|nr:hypothetical protein FN846DRAFT_913932 [Sphaerosporella brunnea]